MDLKDWIGLAVIAFIVLCGLFGLHQLSKPYNVSVEEFERRAKEGPGLIGASVVTLQKALDPSKEKAVEAQEDLKRGRYNREQGSGEPPEAGTASDEHEAELTEGDNSKGERPNA
jgi:hypothetical protein